MPAPAVIPARGNFINAVAVETLVVEPCVPSLVPRKGVLGVWTCLVFVGGSPPAKTGYCEEIRVFKAGYRLNTLAWDNGRASDFVG